jgi:3-oxoacyl-(acyl-carrier-protein) synthase
MVMMQTLMNNVLCYVSIPIDIRGVNANFMDYQAAGLRAMGAGFWAIKEGRADQVVTGGVSGAPDLYHAAEGIDLGYLSPAVDSDQADTDVVRPYDKNRTGTVLSEAAAFCVMESYESAQKRGATIYAEVTGYTMNSEASFHYMKGNTGEAMERCFADHFKRFSISVDQVGGVYGHGNGSIEGDRLDLSVLDNIFSSAKAPVPLTSIKSVLGETNEASGVLSLVDAVCSLKKNVLPGIHNFQGLDGSFGNISVSSKGQDISVPNLLITAKGFSGINTVLSLKIP